jgi:hypothetical protein
MSVLRQGHPMALYCYAEPDGLPPAVELRDAAEILPESRVIRHKSGSVALFANWFRYELQRRALDTWLDTHACLLKPLEGTPPDLHGKHFEDQPAPAGGFLARLQAEGGRGLGEVTRQAATA